MSAAAMSLRLRPFPSDSKIPASGKNWLHEIKQDGFRVIGRNIGKRVRLYSPRQLTEQRTTVSRPMDLAPSATTRDRGRSSMTVPPNAEDWLQHIHSEVEQTFFPREEGQSRA